MRMKPFKPLTIVAREPLTTISSDNLNQRPTKRQRTAARTLRSAKECADDIQQEGISNVHVGPSLVSTAASPSGTLSQQLSTVSDVNDKTWFNVLWRKFTTKKNKTWDSDGILVACNGNVTLQDVSGKSLGRGVSKGVLDVGSELSFSGCEILIESLLSKEEALSGRRFLQNKRPNANAAKPSSFRNTQPAFIRTKDRGASDFKSPLLHNNVLEQQKNARIPTPRHDPSLPDALIMTRPRDIPKGKQIVDVVVDPLLTKHLREHQRIGVSFLYECIMGMKDHAGEGAILADEMGLGKTLQTIALLWTLLKQNPIFEQAPVVKKALIVCPVTLITNWRKEFRKWLGRERIGVFVAGDKDTRISDFTLGRSYSVMIIGYERLRSVKDELLKGHGIDIVIADEGHRLKTAKNKSADAIKSLPTERRIILSGTPMQNDLEEFYTMVDFVNPGLLNKYSVFKREFEIPIMKSQQPGASQDDVEKGEARSEELATITNMFVLRRSADILSKYLPTKTEYVLFCRPTTTQIVVYKAILQSPIYSSALNSPGLALELINVLKKVCNSPNLLLKKAKDGEESTRKELFDFVPTNLLRSADASGKLQVLDSLLHQIRTTTDDKVVLVSNYTTTLDILSNLLTALSYSHLRLDGSVPAAKRQRLVDQFNRSTANNFFVFLLSAKAGGVGLNLVGANRLVLYDLDWNPAIDLQAMARIHRDGQRKPCYIYRLLTQGALDEKIFQRHASKTGLADSVVDGKSGTSGFSKQELRDIFTLDEMEGCQTHRLLGCECGGTGLPMSAAIEKTEAGIGDQSSDIISAEQGSAIETEHLENTPAWQPNSSFTSGAKIDMEAQEKEIQRRSRESRDSSGRLKLSSLMQYQHLDASTIDAVQVPTPDQEEVEAAVSDADDTLEGVVEDAALRSILREDGRRVGFVLSKISSRAKQD